jgi:hypothetical protein
MPIRQRHDDGRAVVDGWVHPGGVAAIILTGTTPIVHPWPTMGFRTSVIALEKATSLVH